VPFEADDVMMTTGAFSALAIALNAVVDPGDEVIFISPPWFFYETLIVAAGGKPVRVKLDPQSFDLDLAAIDRAITPRTRAMIINSPHNPTGKIYPPQTLAELGRILTRASKRNDRTLYLVSDEAYSRIVFDGKPFVSPACFYPNSFLIYTYGKVLLIPGERIGYIALPPDMPDRAPMRDGLITAQIEAGYAFPNATLQYALPELDKLSIDIGALQQRRDWLAGALRELGYSVHIPEGTFYLLPRAPWSDDWSFTDRLAGLNVLCLPGSVAEMPGYFRISLTASDAMIQHAIPGFAEAIRPSQAA
jgi:aspartate aminotransferase